jgi:4-amino-4-deoxy-L-arabinose transferase-like glycosyltransferase
VEPTTGAPRAADASRRDPIALTALAIVCSIPFLARPLHVDEPVFVRVARQVAAHPLDPFGFEMNWTGVSEPVHAFMQNPPLAGYLLAGIGAALGWSELGLRSGYLLVPLAALLGTFALARRFSGRPFVAALATLFAPGFFVSGGLLMSDVLALACWVSALVLWDRGLREARTGALFGAGALAGLAALSEYFAIALIPLLALHALATTRRAGVWLAALAIPIAVVAGYERATAALYGHSLLLGAANYASEYQAAPLATPLRRLALGLVFTGGCAAAPLALAPALLGRRAFLASVAVLGIASAVLIQPLAAAGRASTAVLVQAGLWCAAGLGALALAADDLRRSRSPASLLLAAWVAGGFTFASFVNWSVSARGVLPLLPALGILLARRLDRRASEGQPPARALVAGGLALCAGLSLAVARADARLASAGRDAARELVAVYGAQGARVWFQGHWGFQHYAEALGAHPLVRGAEGVAPGDRILRPLNNSYLFGLPRRLRGPIARHPFELGTWVSTLSPAAGAGFYAASFGPLPFAFGAAPPEIYVVFEDPAPAVALPQAPPAP